MLTLSIALFMGSFSGQTLFVISGSFLKNITEILSGPTHAITHFSNIMSGIIIIVFGTVQFFH
jgi:hypothetical protein